MQHISLDLYPHHLYRDIAVGTFVKIWYNINIHEEMYVEEYVGPWWYSKEMYIWAYWTSEYRPNDERALL